MNPKFNHKLIYPNTHHNQNTIAELMLKAKNTQLQRQQLIITKCHHTNLKQQHFSTNHNSNSNLSQQLVNNVSQQFIVKFPSKQYTQISTKNHALGRQPQQTLPLPQINSLQSSFRHFQTNRTLEPYLINIRQEYICSNPVNEHQQINDIHQQLKNKYQQLKNDHQKLKDKHQKLKNQKLRQVQPVSNSQPLSNSESIQLSESREISEEMLLHNSVTSKFLESPTLSLGLVESKITKKQVDSQNNTKILKKKRLKPNQFQISTGQILFLAHSNQEFPNKQQIKDYEKQIQNYEQMIKDYQSAIYSWQQAGKKRETRDVFQQFPQNAIKQLQIGYQVRETIENKVYSPSDPQFSNSIMTSYQMEVQYLRKINLYQSFQIQKLRKLIRTHQNQHQLNKPTIFNQNHNQLIKPIKNHQDQHKKQINQQQQQNYNKNNFKKAIDIIKRRQTLNQNKILTQPLKQTDTNIKNTSIDNKTDVQFISGDYSHDLINRKSVSFTTNPKFTSDTFHSLNQKSTINHKPNKSKPKKKTYSICDKNSISISNQNLPLNCKSQSLNMSTQQMMNTSMGKHNLSCNTYFMAAKSIKKSAKSKTSHSQQNLSTIVSSQNKENNAPKVSTKNNKKGTKKRSILTKDIQMFVSTKKHTQHLSLMTKKKK